MPEQATMPSPELAAELRQYFAATTGVDMPRGVRSISARTMRARRRSVRRSLTTLFAGGGAAVATAGLVVGIIALRHESYDSTSASRPAVAAPAFGGNGTFEPSIILYPGVDTSRLAQFGDVLLPPDAHGSARVTPAQAQAAAVASQPHAGAPGPAVLAWAQVTGGLRPNPCLCWVVDLPITGGVGVGGTLLTPPTIPSARTVLVLVDAATGRIFATLSAPGIP